MTDQRPSQRRRTSTARQTNQLPPRTKSVRKRSDSRRKVQKKDGDESPDQLVSVKWILVVSAVVALLVICGLGFLIFRAPSSESLVQRLGRQYPDEAEQLLATRGIEAVPAIVQGLNDSHPEISFRCARLLTGELSQHSEVTTALVNTLPTAREEIQRQIIEALRKVTEISGEDLSTLRTFASQHGPVSSDAMSIIVQADSSRTIILEILKSPSDRDQIALLKALAAAGTSMHDLTDNVRPLVDAGNVQTQIAAVETLVAIAAPSDDVVPVLQKLLFGQDVASSLRIAAALAATRARSPSSLELIRMLLASGRVSSSPAVLSKIAERLTKDKDASGPLLPELINSITAAEAFADSVLFSAVTSGSTPSVTITRRNQIGETLSSKSYSSGAGARTRGDYARERLLNEWEPVRQKIDAAVLAIASSDTQGVIPLEIRDAIRVLQASHPDRQIVGEAVPLERLLCMANPDRIAPASEKWVKVLAGRNTFLDGRKFREAAVRQLKWHADDLEKVNLELITVVYQDDTLRLAASETLRHLHGGKTLMEVAGEAGSKYIRDRDTWAHVPIDAMKMALHGKTFLSSELRSELSNQFKRAGVGEAGSVDDLLRVVADRNHPNRATFVAALGRQGTDDIRVLNLLAGISKDTGEHTAMRTLCATRLILARPDDPRTRDFAVAIAVDPNNPEELRGGIVRRFGNINKFAAELLLVLEKLATEPEISPKFQSTVESEIRTLKRLLN